jgi:hypothetical protein
LKAGLKTKNIVLGLSSQDLNRFFHALEGEMITKEFSERALLKEIIKRNPRILFKLVGMMF